MEKERKKRLIKFLNARDRLISSRGAERIQELEILKITGHDMDEESEWLCKVLHEIEPTCEKIELAFNSQITNPFNTKNDTSRALFYEVLFRNDYSGVAMLNAAKLGHTCAQSIISEEVSFFYNERYNWAMLAAKSGDRWGLWSLSYLLERGIGCEVDLVKSKEALKLSAELGFARSMLSYALSFDEFELLRYVWLKRAAFSSAARKDVRKDFKTIFLGEIRLLLDMFQKGNDDLGYIVYVARSVYRGCF